MCTDGSYNNGLYCWWAVKALAGFLTPLLFEKMTSTVATMTHNYSAVMCDAIACKTEAVRTELNFSMLIRYIVVVSVSGKGLL